MHLDWCGFLHQFSLLFFHQWWVILVALKNGEICKSSTAKSHTFNPELFAVVKLEKLYSFHFRFCHFFFLIVGPPHSLKCQAHSSYLLFVSFQLLRYAYSQTMALIAILKIVSAKWRDECGSRRLNETEKDSTIARAGKLGGMEGRGREREADRVEGETGGVAGVEKNESEEIRLIPI